MSPRRVSLLLAACALAACQSKKVAVQELPTVTVSRGDIAVRVQATGTVEPVDTVVIKSKAQGQVDEMRVDVGSVVKTGDTLVRVNPRDVQNQFDQAKADDVVSQATMNQSRSNKSRTDSLFARGVVPASTRDSTVQDYAAAAADLVNKRAALDLARQQLEDATVEAPINGIVISRPVTVGQIISSALSANDGTAIMTIADLSRVRMRVTVDEVEMADVRVGEPATVAVDAYPDHPFNGMIEKIEPQAEVVQGVTFFPVQISIDNREGLLLPGMNGEVTIRAADLKNVVQVPIDAIRPTNELAALARMFAIPIDTLTNELRPDLIAGEGTTGVPGRYAVVQMPDNSYEMRLIKTGPTDLRVVQVLDGLKEGDKVVTLGAIMTDRPALPPILQIASSLKRPPMLGDTAPAAQAGAAKKGASPASASGAPPAATSRPRAR